MIAPRPYTASELAALREIAATAEYLTRAGKMRDYHEGKLALATFDFFGMDVPDQMADLVADAAHFDACEDAREAEDHRVVRA